jgi:hypothetical protein
LLRCVQTGITIEDLEHLEEGTVFDMMTESVNDTVEYPKRATQEDFDRFRKMK